LILGQASSPEVYDKFYHIKEERMRKAGRVSCAVGKTTLLLGVLLFLVFPGFGQQKTWPRFEFNIAGGYGLTQFDGVSTYAYEWSYQYLDFVKETTDLSMKAENAFSLRAGFTYFFTPMIGVQLGGGFFSSNVPVEGTFTFQHKWTTSSTTYTNERTWAGDGKMSVVPIYLNLVGKFSMSFVDIVLTAGPTLYMNSYESNSYVGFGDTLYFIIWPYAYQYIDAFQIPVEIPKTSWTAFGGNIGIGFDFKVTPQVAISLEGRYFLVPSKELFYEWIPGTYTGVIYEQFEDWEYTADDLQDYQDMMTGVNVKPSFFAISVGVKYAFGLK
jgi:opacity protein-like surface antigen